MLKPQCKRSSRRQHVTQLPRLPLGSRGERGTVLQNASSTVGVCPWTDTGVPLPAGLTGGAENDGDSDPKLSVLSLLETMK